MDTVVVVGSVSRRWCTCLPLVIVAPNFKLILCQCGFLFVGFISHPLFSECCNAARLNRVRLLVFVCFFAFLSSVPCAVSGLVLQLCSHACRAGLERLDCVLIVSSFERSLRRKSLRSEQLCLKWTVEVSQLIT